MNSVNTAKLKEKIEKAGGILDDTALSGTVHRGTAAFQMQNRNLRAYRCGSSEPEQSVWTMDSRRQQRLADQRDSFIGCGWVKGADVETPNCKSAVIVEEPYIGNDGRLWCRVQEFALTTTVIVTYKTVHVLPYNYPGVYDGEKAS